MTREFIRALKIGSTRPVMILLALTSMVQAAQFLLADTPMMVSRKIALSYVAHPDFWAYAHITIAMLMIWRLTDTESRPIAAWFVNAMMFGIWVATYISPAIALEDARNLVSVILAFPAGAFWVLVRTEATPRDRVNA